MASAGFAGYKGIVKLSTSSTGGATTKIAELREYTVNGDHDTFDVTSHDSSGERERIAGIRSWSASAQYLHVDDQTQQELAFDVMNGGLQVGFEFMPIGSSSGTYWSGQGFISHWEQSAPNEDAHASAIDIEGTSVLTLTTSTG